MASPQGGYPPQEGYGQPAGYGSPSEQLAGLAPGASAPAQHGGKKKRAYAGEAFDFGSGANAALGGQMPAGGTYGGYPAQPPAAGYQQPAYGADPTQMQAAAQGYAPPAAPAVAQMTQQFGAMGVTDPHLMPPQAAPQPVQAPRPVPLNQLYPTDLLTQPFNVAELDYPPPPIVLPPGVCTGIRKVLLFVWPITDNP
jgi:protein transport protein SEC24